MYIYIYIYLGWGTCDLVRSWGYDTLWHRYLFQRFLVCSLSCQVVSQTYIEVIKKTMAIWLKLSLNHLSPSGLTTGSLEGSWGLGSFRSVESELRSIQMKEWGPIYVKKRARAEWMRCKARPKVTPPIRLLYLFQTNLFQKKKCENPTPWNTRPPCIQSF